MALLLQSCFATEAPLEVGLVEAAVGKLRSNASAVSPLVANSLLTAIDQTGSKEQHEDVIIQLSAIQQASRQSAS